MSDAEQGEVLQQLVAERAGADDEDPRVREPVLVPPRDQRLPVIPAVGVVDLDGEPPLRRERSWSAGSDLRDEAQDIAVLDAGVVQRLVVADLAAALLVVELV